MMDTEHFFLFSLTIFLYHIQYIYIVITFEALLGSMVWITLIIIYNTTFFSYWDQNSHCLVILKICHVSINAVFANGLHF